MKKYLWQLLAVMFALAACQSNKKETTQTDTLHQDTLAVAAAPNKLMEEFAHIIHGVWVKKAYLDEVVKSKSPYAASELAGLVLIDIPLLSRNTDTLITSVSWGNHETGDVPLIFAEKRGKYVAYLNEGDEQTELAYDIIGHDTILSRHSKNSNEKGGNAYIKVPGKLTWENAVQYMLSKGLFAGQYTYIDTSGRQSSVTFEADGKVEGLSVFKTFYILDDFVAQETDEGQDEIIFDLYSKKQTRYNFKINADTLNLTPVTSEISTNEDQANRSKYKLIRVRN